MADAYTIATERVWASKKLREAEQTLAALEDWQRLAHAKWNARGGIPAQVAAKDAAQLAEARARVKEARAKLDAIGKP